MPGLTIMNHLRSNGVACYCRGVIGWWCLLAALLAGGPAGAQALKSWNGAATPALDLPDLDGKQHRLAGYRGRVLLVNFWATWCEPCRDEMPAMQRLRQRFADKPFTVVAVNAGESAARIHEYLTKEKVALDFVFLRDHSGAAMKAWRVRGLPASFILGADGRILYSQLGELNWDDERLVAQIARLLP